MTADLLFDVPGQSVDDQTAALLLDVAGRPEHDADRRRIVAAIVRDARDHGGRVDPNRVRARLANADGALTVRPQVVGAVYQALTRTKHLAPHGYVTSTDRHGGNAGRPLRGWRLVINPTHGDRS